MKRNLYYKLLKKLINKKKILKIPKKFTSMKNNFVNITNPILGSNEKVFQIYPIVKKLWKLKKNPKIIYMGKFFFS